MKRITLFSLVFAVACGGKQSGSDAPKEVPPVLTSLAAVGLDAPSLDRAADPCNDFYQFACGGWLAANPMPADRSSIGRFSEIFDRGEATLRAILEELKTSQNLDAEMTMVRDFYGACMDETAIEAAGATPLQPWLKRIAAVRNRTILAQVIGELHNIGISPAFELGADADFKDATQTIAQLDQGGLGLPDRDYYVSEEASMVEIRATYTDHVEKMFVLSGSSVEAAKAATANVLAFETRLAGASKTRVERRDIPAMYNKIDRAGVSGLAPTFDWNAYFTARGNAALDGINVGAPGFLQQLGVETEKTPLVQWRDYLAWHVIRAMAGDLSKAFVDQAFAMSSKVSGQKEQRPRWKRCLAKTNGAVGEFLAKPYLERMFPGRSKELAVEMVNEISTAFTGTLAEIPWMSDSTKAKAARKRTAMSFLIGYPDNLKRYDFTVGANTHAANALAASEWDEKRILAKVGKQTDRSEWYMLPQTVNAYYDPLTNQMAFPAGILQSPFFSAKASASVNLGAMGMIVGHELTHGFDDQGAQFGPDGNMENWWQPADLKEFQAKGQCVVDQYATYQPLPGKPVNGKLTLGENIADIGGVKLAFRAHRERVKGAAPVVADGFTDDQQFFLAVGQAWCAKRTDKRAEQLLVIDPHSPPKFRVNGALTNQPEFAAAFSCEAGTPMNPVNRCEVW